MASRRENARDLARVALRDPEHVPERLALFAARRHSGPAGEWAERVRAARPDVSPAALAEELRLASAKVARVDGAIAGTPFFLALVPGYIAYLQQEARMSLRIAALYGRDPAELRTAAEMLALRGVHPTPEAAEKSLIAVREAGMPAKPSERRPIRSWVRAAYMLAVFGGFLGAPNRDVEQTRRHPRLRTVVGMVAGGAIWVTTWVFPVSFMVAMAWGCESHTRQLGRRVIALYGGEAATAEAAIEAAERRQDRGHDVRTLLRTGALVLSVAVPLAFIAYVDHVRQSTGVNWLGAVGALVGLSLVIAIALVSSRR
ncbi:MAG TPA: hypothetical protein VF731_13560 [Solirubrobacterales bacterium]